MELFELQTFLRRRRLQLQLSRNVFAAVHRSLLMLWTTSGGSVADLWTSLHQ